MKKNLIAIVVLTACTMTAFGQSKDDLKNEIEQLKQQNAMLMQMMSNMQQTQQYQNPQQYPQQQYQQGQPMMQGYGQQPQENSMFGVAVQRSRVEDAALTATGSDIRGYGREQSAKSNFARNKAENQARMELARQIEAYARYALNQYNEETLAGGQTGLDANDQESAITAAKNVIEGARILDSQEYYDPNSRMYTWEVCVVYDRAGLYSVMEEQSARIKKNKAKFEQDMQKYFDEMDHMQGRLTEAERAQAVQNQMEQDNLNAQQQRDMQMRQQQFDNNQQSVQQQQQYNLQYQQQQNQYNLQQNQQNQQYNQQRQYNGQNYQYQQNYKNGTHYR
ncbi:MAG: hypothetical protein K2H98_03080 [Duncaniella sp.]|nr:hypothetical protein [Duncaniella sp.]